MTRVTVAISRRPAGFTLIELLVVVMIIGILASMGIPQYYKVVERSRAAEANNLIALIRSAQERFMTQNGNYAGTVNSLDVGIAACTANSTTERCGMKSFILESMSQDANQCGQQPGFSMQLKRTTAGGVQVGKKYEDYTISYNRCNDTVIFSQTDLQ